MACRRVVLQNRGGREVVVDGEDFLLDALEDAGVVLPYGCRYGGCITCAAKLLSGEVEQSRAEALKPSQLAAGYILPCVARPLSDCVLEVGVESHDNLYRNPFQNPKGFR